MGEYAEYNGEQVKIGTCENMYYLRYEDRGKVKPLAHSLDPVTEANGLRFRLPFIDEDSMGPGEYRNHNRGLRLYKTDDSGYARDIILKDMEPGSIQLKHDCGLLINVPCYHGEKLPDLGGQSDDCCDSLGRVLPTAFWNGKSWFFELVQLKATKEGVLPVVRCRHCGEKWRFDWSDIWDYIPSDMQERLSKYRIAVNAP